MPAGSKTFTVEQGASWSIAVTLKVGGVARNLTGYSGRGQVRLTTASQTVLATLDVDITNAAAGQFTVSLAPDALDGLDLAGPTHRDYLSAVYDVELYTAGDADVIRVLAGTMRISPGVTRG